MPKLNDVANELSRIWHHYTNAELCKHYQVCSNTLWRWKEKLNLPNKIVGRPNLEVRFKDNNYGLSLNDQVICMLDNSIIFGKVKGFKNDKVNIEAEDGKELLLNCLDCKKEFFN